MNWYAHRRTTWISFLTTRDRKTYWNKKTSVVRMVKRNGRKNYKRVKTQQMSNTLKQRRTERESCSAWREILTDQNENRALSVTSDYHLWDKVKTKVYDKWFNWPFGKEEKLKRRIKRVWEDVAQKLVEIRKALKQFEPWLQTAAEKQGNCIEMVFSWMF